MQPGEPLTLIGVIEHRQLTGSCTIDKNVGPSTDNQNLPDSLCIRLCPTTNICTSLKGTEREGVTALFPLIGIVSKRRLSWDLWKQWHLNIKGFFLQEDTVHDTEGTCNSGRLQLLTFIAFCTLSFFMFEANRDKTLTILFPFIRHELLVSVKAKWPIKDLPHTAYTCRNCAQHEVLRAFEV